jgi:IS1 family transposase/transposase-like protein
MRVQIIIKCPRCGSEQIVRNGKKPNGKQLYKCRDCNRQFIADHEKTYRGTISWFVNAIKRALVRGCGIRDVSVIFEVSIGKILATVIKSCYEIKPKQQHYTCLEVDELWTFVGSKANKQWLIYAYDRDSGEIVAYVWGSRDAKTAKDLRDKLRELGITYDRIATDDWESFVKTFNADTHDIGKQHTVGIEGNNCRLRHRMRRIFRKSCNFSKKLINHQLAFDMTAFYVNFGVV